MTKTDNRSSANDHNGNNTAHQLAPLTLEVKKGNITYTPDGTTYKTPIIIDVDIITGGTGGTVGTGTIPDTNEVGLHLEKCDLTTNNGHANIDGNLTVTGNLEVENSATFGAGVTFKCTPTFEGSLNIGVDGGLTVGGSVEFTNQSIKLSNLPKSNPNEPGRLYNDSGILKISS